MKKVVEPGVVEFAKVRNKADSLVRGRNNQADSGQDGQPKYKNPFPQDTMTGALTEYLFTMCCGFEYKKTRKYGLFGQEYERIIAEFPKQTNLASLESIVVRYARDGWNVHLVSPNIRSGNGTSIQKFKYKIIRDVKEEQ